MQVVQLKIYEYLLTYVIIKQLYDYQYNMGILLLERKDWSTKYEEMREEFLATEKALKQENDAHLLSISDLEKREANLKKGLGVEKQCVADVSCNFKFYYCSLNHSFLLF